MAVKQPVSQADTVWVPRAENNGKRGFLALKSDPKAAYTGGVALTVPGSTAAGKNGVAQYKGGRNTRKRNPKVPPAPATPVVTAPVEAPVADPAAATGVPLNSDQQAWVSDSLAQAQQAEQNAMLSVNSRRQQMDVDYKSMLSDYAFQAAAGKEAAGRSLGAAGVGLSPAFMGAAIRNANTAQAAASNVATAERRGKSAALDALLAQARTERLRKNDEVSTQRARWASNLTNLIRSTS